jgi:uncharacterized glyoxalase superfamily protein PhnB
LELPLWDESAGPVGARTTGRITAPFVVTDDVDAVFERAVAAHAEVVERPHETVFGSGGADAPITARDPEGNLWTCATYRGAP